MFRLKKPSVPALMLAAVLLVAAAAAGEDITPLKEKYDQKTAALQEQEERCLAKAREAIPLLQETIDTIREKLASGISIETQRGSAPGFRERRENSGGDRERIA